MKRLLGILAALAIVAGCSATPSTPAGSVTAEPAAPATSESVAPEPASSAPEPASSAPEPAEQPSTQAPTSDSQYAVTINGSHQTKDYNGKKTLVVDFTFTNNSDKAKSFMFAVSAKAFQDGVELGSAIPMNDKKYDAANSMKDVKPGKSIKAQQAYLLDSKADVTIEVTELISLDDTLIAQKTFSVK